MALHLNSYGALRSGDKVICRLSIQSQRALFLAEKYQKKQYFLNDGLRWYVKGFEVKGTAIEFVLIYSPSFTVENSHLKDKTKRYRKGSKHFKNTVLN